MLGIPNEWQKLGRLIAPRANISWMSTWTGPATALRIGDTSRYTVFIAGRDDRNRSQIGTFEINLDRLPEIDGPSATPCLSFGDLGAFDENGVSYPWTLQVEGEVFLYYNGWMPSVLTPFQIHLGLARGTQAGDFSRVSRAPILERTDADHLSIGSAGIMRDGAIWRMWYTAFTRWGQSDAEHKHYYVIKYAESADGIHWRRDDITCIDFKSEDEFSICRPSVIKHGELYHMWFSYRGAQYRIGYATSQDGIHWQRRDGLAGIDVSQNGWDSRGICYSHVFRHGDYLYMLYCGNEYGRDGTGIARLSLESA